MFHNVITILLKLRIARIIIKIDKNSRIQTIPQTQFIRSLKFQSPFPFVFCISSFVPALPSAKLTSYTRGLFNLLHPLCLHRLLHTEKRTISSTHECIKQCNFAISVRLALLLYISIWLFRTSFSIQAFALLMARTTREFLCLPVMEQQIYTYTFYSRWKTTYELLCRYTPLK